MKKLTTLLALALLALPAAALGQGMEHEGEEMAHEEMHAEMTAEVTAAIEAASAAFAEAFNAGDAAAVAAMYTEDAVVMPPGTAAITGRTAIQEGLTEELAQMEGMIMSFEISEVIAAHDGALEVGIWSLDAADGTHVDHGSYMAAWKKTDEGWQMARDIWNSNMGGGE